jgi:hypothetical protein
MDFTVTYEPTPDEVARALRLGVRRQLRVFYWALPAVLVVAGAVCVLVDSTSMGIAMLVAAVVAPFAGGWSIRRLARKQLGHMCVPTVLRFTSEGYEYRTEQSATSLQWSLFSQVMAGPEFWLFFINKQFAAFLPRRAFDPAQQAELDAFLASAISR